MILDTSKFLDIYPVEVDIWVVVGASVLAEACDLAVEFVVFTLNVDFFVNFIVSAIAWVSSTNISGSSDNSLTCNNSSVCFIVTLFVSEFPAVVVSWTGRNFHSKLLIHIPYLVDAINGISRRVPRITTVYEAHPYEIITTVFVSCHNINGYTCKYRGLPALTQRVSSGLQSVPDEGDVLYNIYFKIFTLKWALRFLLTLSKLFGSTILGINSVHFTKVPNFSEHLHVASLLSVYLWNIIIVAV